VRFDSSTFITRSSKNEIIMWKLKEDKEKKLTIHELVTLNEKDQDDGTWFIRMQLDMQGRFLAVGDVDGRIRLWDLKVDKVDDIKMSVIMTVNKKLVRMISFSRDGSTMIAGSEDGKVFRYDIRGVKKEPVDKETIEQVEQ
jgi:WD40 repeat protein